MTDTNGRITVSEETLKRVLAEFKLDLLGELKEYATIVAFDRLESRVKVLELWQASIVGGTRIKREIGSSWLAWAALAVAALGFVATIMWLALK